MAALYDLPFATIRGERTSEVLIYSSAGTGKTMGIGAVLAEWCLDFPGSRFLVVRKTLKSLRNSWQITFEKMVAPRYGIPVPSSSRMSRESYVIGSSEIVLGGLEDAERHRSTEWNAVLFVEATEAEKDDYEEFTRSLRWQNGAPFHLRILETNPKSQFHWIYNRWFGSMDPEEVASHDRVDSGPGMVAMRATIRDNPAFWDLDADAPTPEGHAYISKMEGGYSGAKYQQMVKGIWCVDDGLVYPEFAIHTHVFDGRLQKKAGNWWINTERHGAWRVLGFFGSQDWGIDKPGVGQVWAVDEVQRLWLVREWYHTRWNPNRWAEIWARQWAELNIKRIVCDGADAGAIDILNELLTRRGGRAARKIAVSATGQIKDKMGGRGLVGSKLEQRKGGLPAICFLRKSLQHRPDPEIDGKAPTCTYQEFGGYIMDVDRSGMSKDEPVKRNDHGMDAMRYGVKWFFTHEFKDTDWVGEGWVDPPWMDPSNPQDAELIRQAKRRWNLDRRAS